MSHEVTTSGATFVFTRQTSAFSAHPAFQVSLFYRLAAQATDLLIQDQLEART